MSVSVEYIWTIERYLIIISKLLSILDEFYLDDKYKCNKYLNTFYKCVIYILYQTFQLQVSNSSTNFASNELFYRVHQNSSII